MRVCFRRRRRCWWAVFTLVPLRRPAPPPGPAGPASAASRCSPRGSGSSPARCATPGGSRSRWPSWPPTCSSPTGSPRSRRSPASTASGSCCCRRERPRSRRSCSCSSSRSAARCCTAGWPPGSAPSGRSWAASSAGSVVVGVRATSSTGRCRICSSSPVGVGIGLVLGGTLALTRSLFSQLVPAGPGGRVLRALRDRRAGRRPGSGRCCSPPSADATGSFRPAIISLVVFFVARRHRALALVPVRRAIRAPGNAEPALV